MIEFQNQIISFNELKNGIDKNYYDIMYPQNYYYDKKQAEKKYSDYKNYYSTVITTKIPENDRELNFTYDSTKPMNEKKWIHLFSAPFMTKMVSISHYQILFDYFSINTTFDSDFVVIVPNHNKNAALIHFIISKRIPNVDKNKYIIMNTDKQLMVETNVYTDEYMNNIMKEILTTRDNFIRIKAGGLPPKYFPQFFDSAILHDSYKKLDGVDVGEISILYRCGKKIRDKCHASHIFSFRDVRFLEHVPKTLKPTIQRILAINEEKDSNRWKMIDESIKNDAKYATLCQKYSSNEIFYIDFEFTNEKLYLCGFSDNYNTFQYIWDSESNLNFMKQFIEFIDQHQNCIFIYYSAETKKIKEYLKKYNLTVRDDFFTHFYDLFYFLSTYCSFRYCFDFKLKNIIKAFKKVGIIDQDYEDTGNCQSGCESIDIFENYQLLKNENDKQDIIEYNKLDCLHQKKIMEEILN